MENNLNFRFILKEFQNKYMGWTSERFVSALKELGYTDRHQIRELELQFNKGWFQFITNKDIPERLIVDLINVDFEKLYAKLKFQDFTVRYNEEPHQYKVKVVYKENNEVKSEVLDLQTYLANKRLVELYEDKNVKMLHTLKFVRRIELWKESEPNHKTDIFMGDIIAGYDWFSEKKDLFIAYEKGHYSFRELLWTSKYGFYNPNGSLNIDKTEYKLEDILNIEKEAGEYSVTKKGILIGNIFTNPEILK